MWVFNHQPLQFIDFQTVMPISSKWAFLAKKPISRQKGPFFVQNMPFSHFGFYSLLNQFCLKIKRKA
jgi:hypothetical protein